MSPTIEITKEIYSRLEKHVIGFDSPSSVIGRMIDNYENHHLSIPSVNNVKNESNVNANHSRIFTNKEIQQRLSSIAESLPESELEMLCNEKTSKEVFGISFPLFVKVIATANQTTKKEAVKASDGVNRWTWKFEFSKNGFSYAICTQWYPKNDRFVQQWLNSHK